MENIPYEIIEIIISCLNLGDSENFVKFLDNIGINKEKLNWYIILDNYIKSTPHHVPFDLQEQKGPDYNKVHNYDDYYNMMIAIRLFVNCEIDDHTINEIFSMESVCYNIDNDEIISKDIGKLRNLKKVYLRKRGEKVTEDVYEENLVVVSEFTNINSLYLYFTDLDIHTCILIRFTNITELNINSSWMSSFPTSICKLINLTLLTVNNCGIKELSNKISKLTNLTEVNLSENRLTTFDTVCELSNLTNLNLSSNMIKTISLQISKLIKLEFFDLCCNNIKIIPDETTKLCNLSHLNLNHNEIKTINSNLLPFLKSLTYYGMEDVPVDFDLIKL